MLSPSGDLLVLYTGSQPTAAADLVSRKGRYAHSLDLLIEKRNLGSYTIYIVAFH